MILALGCAAAAACAPGAPEPLFWLVHDAAPPPLCIEFAGRSLTDCTLHIDSASTNAAPALPAAWPAVMRRGGHLQLDSAVGFWFQHEVGLRWQAQIVDDEIAATQFEDSLNVVAASIRQPQAPAAYPRAAVGTWLLETRRTSELKSALAGATHLVDATQSGPGLFANAAFERATLHLALRTPLNPETGERALPARFPRAAVSVAASAQELTWIYPLPNDPGRVLLLRLQSPEAAERARTALEELPRLYAGLLADAAEQPGTLAVTELVFASASGAPRVEVSSDARPVLANLVIETDGGAWRVAEQRYFFAHSAQVYDAQFDADFRMKDALVAAGDLDFQFEKRSIAVLAPQRALVWPEESASAGPRFPEDRSPERLRPADRCVIPEDEICGSAGLAPGILPALAHEETLCTVADFSLTELNPFGVRLANGALAADGKFIEFAARAACAPGRLLFRAGDIWLDPGRSAVQADELIVFAANGAYFEDPLRLAPELRYLRPQHAVEVRDIVSGETRLLRAATLDAYPTPAPARGFPRVHSLRFGPEERHHAASHASGLRPDLRAGNAMSPGRAPPLRIAPLTLQISEILPQGGRAADGTALAAEEFLELVARDNASETNDADDTLILEIYGDGGTLESRYRMAPPALAAGERVALGRAPSICFAGDGRAILPELSLPNRAASYRLANAAGDSLDRVILDRAAYQAIDRSTARVSFARLDYSRGTLWRPGDGEAARSPVCYDGTRATPGAPESFAPFLLREERAVFSQQLRLLGERSAVLWRLEFALLDFASADGAAWLPFTRDVAQALVWNGAGDTPRVLYRLTDCESGVCEFRGGGELFGARTPLVIAAVAATPAAGEQEWLRLCSPDGYDLANETRGLFLEDRRERDAIAPMAQRAPGLAAPGALEASRTRLEPGECAILVDPDYRSGALPLIPADRALWTVTVGASLGDGLASGEALRILRQRETGAFEPLASYGQPEFGGAGLVTRGGEYVLRRAGTLADEIENWAVVQ